MALKRSLYKFFKDWWKSHRLKDKNNYHYMVCRVCGKSVYQSQITVQCFNHIKSRGSHPEKKFDEDNIMFVCPDGECHNEAERLYH